MDYYVEPLKKYVDFSGRARRKEYWMFFLINIIICFFIAGIEHITGLAEDGDSGIITHIYELFLFLPYLSLSVRRLHDINKSGWWNFIVIIPIIGIIVLILYSIREGDSGYNDYGPSPKLTTVRI